MLILSFAASVCADDGPTSYGIRIGDTVLNSSNCLDDGNNKFDKKIVYDTGSNTLYLNGYTVHPQSPVFTQTAPS